MAKMAGPERQSSKEGGGGGGKKHHHHHRHSRDSSASHQQQQQQSQQQNSTHIDIRGYPYKGGRDRWDPKVREGAKEAFFGNIVLFYKLVSKRHILVMQDLPVVKKLSSAKEEEEQTSGTVALGN